LSIYQKKKELAAVGSFASKRDKNVIPILEVRKINQKTTKYQLPKEALKSSLLLPRYYHTY